MEITPAAKEFLARYRNGTFPVPVVDIAEQQGIEVYSDTAYEKRGSGHIELMPDNSVAIIVNANECAARKRFTIAHEMAHFIMDRDYLEQHKSIDRDGDAADETYRARERRANQFAAELLMPENHFVTKWLEYGDMDKVADHFGVSHSAAMWRAVNLGIVKAG